MVPNQYGAFFAFSPPTMSAPPNPTDLHQAHPVGLVETSQKTANRETHPRYQVSPARCAVMRRKSVTDMKVSRGSAVQTDAAYFGLRLKVLVSVSTVLVNHENSIHVVS
jgi:hypothetical protein